MYSSFEKFSENARQTLSLAQTEAQTYNHNYIGTEHILVALTKQPQSTATKVLHNLNISPDNIQLGINHIMLDMPKNTQDKNIGLTDRAKKIVELAVNETSQTNKTYLGTEDFLIGILVDDETHSAQILKYLGATLATVRTETNNVLHM